MIYFFVFFVQYISIHNLNFDMEIFLKFYIAIFFVIFM